ncbi:hypothetical protein MNV49_005172 [Pseudohyphozyma bogoriensis]|nr:hypothetical protein MNV49_005172 [Pseudohyphozyma bogoriensis]
MLRASAVRVARQAAAAPAGRRMMHVDNVVYNNTPFDYKNGAALGVKMVAFLGVGFATPFIASAYQLHILVELFDAFEVVACIGAGVSTAAGIRISAIEAGALARREDVTTTHGFFRELKRMGKLRRVYSQNIDALEEAAGLAFVGLPGVTPGVVVLEEDDERKQWDGEVVQLHGSLRSVRCSKCDWVGEWTDEHSQAFGEGEVLACALKRKLQSKRTITPREPSFLRPAVLLYDEPLSRASETIASISQHDLNQKPDMLLVMGTSLKIAGFKALVKEFAREVRSRGGITVFVNLEEVGQEWSDVFDYHIKAKCDDFSTRILSDWREVGPEDFPTSLSSSSSSILPEPSAFTTLLSLPPPITSPRFERRVAHLPTPELSDFSPPPSGKRMAPSPEVVKKKKKKQKQKAV